MGHFKFNFNQDKFNNDEFFPLYYDYCDNLPKHLPFFAWDVADVYVDLLCYKKFLNEKKPS